MAINRKSTAPSVKRNEIRPAKGAVVSVGRAGGTSTSKALGVVRTADGRYFVGGTEARKLVGQEAARPIQGSPDAKTKLSAKAIASLTKKMKVAA